ncbi:MAG: hypothetical protein ABRQ23_00860 [Syntrophomonadaceae bacterium]
MQHEIQKSDELEKMIEALIRYYDGSEDFFEKELKGKSEAVIREMYRKVYETDEDNTRVEEEEEDR